MPPALDTVPAPHRDAPRRVGRWIAIGVVSLLVHLAAFDLLPHWTLRPADDAVNEEPLRATLMPAIETPAKVAAPPTPTAAPVARPKPVPRRPASEPFVPDSSEPVPEVRAATDATPPAPAPSPTPSPAPKADAPPAVVDAPPAAANAPPPPAAIAPRSARLSYQVVSVDTKNAQPTHYYGVGSIDWNIADGRYRSDLSAALKILFVEVNVLALRSEGVVAAGGLMPDRYTETPRRRATVATSFNRDARQSITFSSSQASVPLVPGVQDRLSVLFQIGALLLANGQQGGPGTRIEMPVAGIRGEVETWSFENQGVETIDTGPGPLSTTHLRRAPRPGSNDRTIDVWIAQQDGGYPARVLYTEPNGSTIEMTLEKIGAAPQ